MRNRLHQLMLTVTRVFHEEIGQDLLEYAFVAALIGFGTVAAMSSVASKVTLIFSTVGASITSTV